MANLLLTCATKLTVNGTTTAPEHLMVCGNARFVNSGTNNIYMGTSHGSVDIDFNRAASQYLKIRTNIMKNLLYFFVIIIIARTKKKLKKKKLLLLYKYNLINIKLIYHRF